MKHDAKLQCYRHSRANPFLARATQPMTFLILWVYISSYFFKLVIILLLYLISILMMEIILIFIECLDVESRVSNPQ